MLATSRLVLLAFFHSCVSTCFFPEELQGTFVMQASIAATHQVQYSRVLIDYEAIPIWGHCHRRIGHHVILMDSSGVEDCIRCFLLNLRSRNVLQVHTEGLAKCYTSEEAAQSTCPQEGDQHDRSREILLYKVEDMHGDLIKPEYCPINGRFTFTYNVNDGSENNVECPSPVSEMHTCPTAHGINLEFRRCSFDNHDITFQCLGHWEGPGTQRYLALLDTRQDGDNRPRYRCALYHEDSATGNMAMAFSSDSTCRSDLHSSVSGFETLSLTSMPGPRWPSEVHTSNCRFPQWMHGKWQYLTIDNNLMIYQDHSSFKTYSMRCLDDQTQHRDRFLLFAHTQCGEQMYSCIWIKQRSYNVLEFQLGLHSTSSYNATLCSDWNFHDHQQWTTQGRIEEIEDSPCPIPGEYAGEIPDGSGYCAKLWSHCNTSQTMYYTVADCNSTQVFEERQYRCLGQWEEGGRVYTYTQRKDVSSYECFVGKIISQKQIYIKEAGEVCERSIDPLENGMQLSRQGPCYQEKPVTLKARTTTTIARYSNQPMPEPTKPWKPITGRPHHVNSGKRFSSVFVLITGLLGFLLAQTSSHS